LKNKLAVGAVEKLYIRVGPLVNGNSCAHNEDKQHIKIIKAIKRPS
jgi:hypothetical protein